MMNMRSSILKLARQCRSWQQQYGKRLNSRELIHGLELGEQEPSQTLRNEKYIAGNKVPEIFLDIQSILAALNTSSAMNGPDCVSKVNKKL